MTTEAERKLARARVAAKLKEISKNTGHKIVEGADKAIEGAKKTGPKIKEAGSKIASGTNTVRDKVAKVIESKKPGAKEKVKQAKEAYEKNKPKVKESIKTGTEKVKTSAESLKNKAENKARSTAAKNKPLATRPTTNAGGGGGKNLIPYKNPQTKPTPKPSAGKSGNLLRILKKHGSPSLIASLAEEGTRIAGNLSLDKDKTRAENLRTQDQLGPLAPVGVDIYNPDEFNGPHRQYAAGIGEWWDRTDVSAAAKYNALEALWNPNWKAPTEGNFPEAEPTGRGAEVARLTADADARLSGAVQAANIPLGQGATTLTGLQTLRRGLNDQNIVTQNPENPDYAGQRKAFATVADNIGDATPENVALALEQTGVNPDLQQQVGLTQTQGIAPLVGYDKTGRPIQVAGSEISTLQNFRPAVNEDKTAAPYGSGGGEIRRRLQPDGSMLFTDMPQAGAVPSTETIPSLDADLRANTPQFGQKAIDETLRHLDTNERSVDSLARLGSNTGPGSGIRVLGGTQRMRDRNARYRAQERTALQNNIDNAWGQMLKGTNDPLPESTVNALRGRRADPNAPPPLRSLEEIAAIEDPTQRRAALMQRRETSRMHAAAELETLLNPEAVRMAVDPTGEFYNAPQRSKRREYTERAEAYQDVISTQIQAKYGLGQRDATDALDPYNSGMNALDVAEFNRENLEFNLRQADRNKVETTSVIDKMAPPDKDGKQTKKHKELTRLATEHGIFDANMSEAERSKTIAGIAMVKELRRIYPAGTDKALDALIEKAGPNEIALSFANLVEAGEIEIEDPSFFRGLVQPFTWDAMQGVDEMGAELQEFWNPYGSRMIKLRRGNDRISVEEFAEELGIDQDELRLHGVR